MVRKELNGRRGIGLVIAAVITTIVMLTAVSGGTAQASQRPLAGTWTGSYSCSQGITGLRLVIRVHGSALAATFSFYALKRNPGVPSGEYTLTGTYSATRMTLKPGHWLKEPAGYEMVGLTGGAPTDHGKVLRGRISNPACSTFSVTRSLSVARRRVSATAMTMAAMIGTIPQTAMPIRAPK
jgi:hypothetical protein